MPVRQPTETGPLIPTEYGPDNDWHGAIHLFVNHRLVVHRTFIDHDEAEGWVMEQLHEFGPPYGGTVSPAPLCPFCRWN